MIRPVLIPMKAVQTYSNRIHPYWILAGDVFNAIDSMATLKPVFLGGRKHGKSRLPLLAPGS